MEEDLDSEQPYLFLLPMKVQHNLRKPQFESYLSMIGKLRDEVIFFIPLIHCSLSYVKFTCDVWNFLTIITFYQELVLRGNVKVLVFFLHFLYLGLLKN